MFSNIEQRLEVLDIKYGKLAEQIKKRMPEALTAIVIEHIPELQTEKEKNRKIIYSIAQEYTDNIWDDFTMIDMKQYYKKDAEIVELPRFDTKEEDELDIQKNLENMPEKYHAGYRELREELYDHMKIQDDFVATLYTKMKEIFADVYLEDVLSLDSDYLREFDNTLYFEAYWFVEDVYSMCRDSLT